MTPGRKPGTPKTGGRKKGTPNKLTASAKEAFAHAFEQIGGGGALAEWAQENRTEFYKLFARLIPTEIGGVDGEPILHHHKVEWVNGKPPTAGKA